MNRVEEVALELVEARMFAAFDGLSLDAKRILLKDLAHALEESSDFYWVLRKNNKEMAPGTTYMTTLAYRDMYDDYEKHCFIECATMSILDYGRRNPTAFLKLIQEVEARWMRKQIKWHEMTLELPMLANAEDLDLIAREVMECRARIGPVLVTIGKCKRLAQDMVNLSGNRDEIAWMKPGENYTCWTGSEWRILVPRWNGQKYVPRVGPRLTTEITPGCRYV